MSNQIIKLDFHFFSHVSSVFFYFHSVSSLSSISSFITIFLSTISFFFYQHAIYIQFLQLFDNKPWISFFTYVSVHNLFYFAYKWIYCGLNSNVPFSAFLFLVLLLIHSLVFCKVFHSGVPKSSFYKYYIYMAQ